MAITLISGVKFNIHQPSQQQGAVSKEDLSYVDEADLISAGINPNDAVRLIAAIKDISAGTDGGLSADPGINSVSQAANRTSSSDITQHTKHMPAYPSLADYLARNQQEMYGSVFNELGVECLTDIQYVEQKDIKDFVQPDNAALLWAFIEPLKPLLADGASTDTFIRNENLSDCLVRRDSLHLLDTLQDIGAKNPEDFVHINFQDCVKAGSFQLMKHLWALIVPFHFNEWTPSPSTQNDPQPPNESIAARYVPTNTLSPPVPPDSIGKPTRQVDQERHHKHHSYASNALIRLPSEKTLGEILAEHKAWQFEQTLRDIGVGSYADFALLSYNDISEVLKPAEAAALWAVVYSIRRESTTQQRKSCFEVATGQRHARGDDAHCMHGLYTIHLPFWSTTIETNRQLTPRPQRCRI